MWAQNDEPVVEAESDDTDDDMPEMEDGEDAGARPPARVPSRAAARRSHARPCKSSA